MIHNCILSVCCVTMAVIIFIIVTLLFGSLAKRDEMNEANENEENDNDEMNEENQTSSPVFQYTKPKITSRHIRP
jgi:H+/gluconate symporter-like permease